MTKEKIFETLKDMPKQDLQNLLNTLLRETNEKPNKNIEQMSDEELVGAIIYLLDKYPALQRYIPLHQLDEFFDKIEHFNIWDAAKKIGKALFGEEEEKTPTQPPPPTIIQTGGNIPGWVWIAVIGLLVVFLLLLVVIVLVK